MRKAIALPSIIAAGIARAERERRANVIARPMRNLMDMLRQGEVFELDGRAVMRMPEIDEQFATRAEWCEIAPAIRGWIDCWKRLAPDLRLYHMAVLADRLEADKLAGTVWREHRATLLSCVEGERERYVGIVSEASAKLSAAAGTPGDHTSRSVGRRRPRAWRRPR